MRFHTIALLGTLAFALGLAGPATASSFVDITYDLSDTSVLTNAPLCPAPGCGTTALLGGSMTIRYTSNSASSMPILHGPATLQSLALSASAVNYVSSPAVGPIPFTVAQMNIGLVSPVVGSLLSGGTLTFGGAQIRAAGRRHCLGASILYTGLCVAFGATITSIIGPLGPYTSAGTLSLAASPGPYGGAQSTRQTVSGSISVRVPSKVTRFVGYYFVTGASLVGREVLRQAPGHEPKVTPEPGTLLLLGAGTAGLALVGCATRRSPRS